MWLIVISANPGSRPGQAPESRFFSGFWTPAFAGVTVSASLEIISYRRSWIGFQEFVCEQYR